MALNVVAGTTTNSTRVGTSRDGMSVRVAISRRRTSSRGRTTYDLDSPPGTMNDSRRVARAARYVIGTAWLAVNEWRARHRLQTGIARIRRRGLLLGWHQVVRNACWPRPTLQSSVVHSVEFSDVFAFTSPLSSQIPARVREVPSDSAHRSVTAAATRFRSRKERQQIVSIFRTICLQLLGIPVAPLPRFPGEPVAARLASCVDHNESRSDSS